MVRRVDETTSDDNKKGFTHVNPFLLLPVW